MICDFQQFSDLEDHLSTKIIYNLPGFSLQRSKYIMNSMFQVLKREAPTLPQTLILGPLLEMNLPFT